MTRSSTFHQFLEGLATRVSYYRGPKQSERIVEYPFIFENLQDLPRGARILDVGCTPSILPVELAALGYKVWGIDLVEYPGSHPNFTFVKGRIEKTSFPDEFFDVVTCVSTLEHIGLYGFLYTFTDIEGDKKAMKEIARVTKKGGKILVTVPYGTSYTSVNYRVYGAERLRRLTESLKTDKLIIYMYKQDKWSYCTEEEAAGAPYSETLAIACLALSKQGLGETRV
jgi:ubiquinone/menaquinone biosynthesis C-methylase UbiE